MNEAFYKKCPMLSAMRRIGDPDNKQLRAGLMELACMVSNAMRQPDKAKPHHNELVTIVTIRSDQPHFVIEGKMDALFAGTAITVFVEREYHIVRFSTYKGITENDRMALEDILKGLRELFGKD